MNKNRKPENESRLKMNWRYEKRTQGKWVVCPSWHYRKGISAKENTKNNKPDEYTVYANIERKTLGGQDSSYSIAIASMQTYSDGNRPMDEVEANANLIALAPEMLEKLQHINKTLQKCANTQFEGESPEGSLQGEIYRLIKETDRY